MIEVGLAVGASVGWGASEFVAGVASRRWPVIVVLAGSQLASLVLVAGIVVATGSIVPRGDAAWLALAAGVFEVAGFAALYKALASGPMGPVAPVAALGGLVPLAVSLAGGGTLAAGPAVGIVLGLVGIVLVSWDGEEQQRRALTRPLLLAGLASLCFGMFFLLLAKASQGGGALEAVAFGRVAAVVVTAPFLIAALAKERLARQIDDLLERASEAATTGSSSGPETDPASGSTAVAVAVAPAPPRIRAARRTWLSPADLATIVAVGVLDVAANVLYATSTSRSSDVGVQIVASACPVATVLLARLVLGERMSGVQGVGVWLTIGAVLLIGGG